MIESYDYYKREKEAEWEAHIEEDHYKYSDEIEEKDELYRVLYVLPEIECNDEFTNSFSEKVKKKLKSLVDELDNMIEGD